MLVGRCGCLRNISKWETFLFIKLTPTPLLSGGRPCGRTARFPSLMGYDVWMKALSRYNDCTPRFSRARSWQSHFLCNFMVVFLNEDIGCSEARGQSLPAPFSGLFRSMFPFTWWKVIHHLHPWILPLPPHPPALLQANFPHPSPTRSAHSVPRRQMVQHGGRSAVPKNRLALPGLAAALRPWSSLSPLYLWSQILSARASFSTPKVALAPSGAWELQIDFFSPSTLKIYQVPFREAVDSQ